MCYKQSSRLEFGVLNSDVTHSLSSAALQSGFVTISASVLLNGSHFEAGVHQGCLRFS
jgi:hypothetical protein